MGLGRGWACIGIQSGAESGLSGLGWGGVGHALGFNSITLRLGPGYKDRPKWGCVGPVRPVGPVRAEGLGRGWACMGLSGVGEGLGMH